MKPEYAAYLDELIEAKRMHYAEGHRDTLDRATILYAECSNFTKKFVQRFPHLKRVAGFYCVEDDLNAVEMLPGTEHWWCVDVDGTIVDPTAEQFSQPGPYVPLDEKVHFVRVGRCHNCGIDIYGLLSEAPQSVCSDECRDALTEAYQ